MTNNDKKTIRLEAIDPVEIYGAANKVLEALCSYFPNLKVVARGNEIMLEGKDSEIEEFGKNGIDVIMYVAYVLSWACSIIYSFITNKFVVFHSEETNDTKKQFVKFVLSRAVSLLISIVGAFIFDTILGFNTYIVKVVFSVIVVVFNYFAGKFFVFGRKKEI